MPLFQQTLKQKFTPKKVKFSDVYKTSTGKNTIGSSVHQQAVTAMQKAGFDESKIRKTIYKNEELTIKEMKDVASALNKAGIYGFTKSPKTVVEKHVNKERVKRQSIAAIRKEHILEAGEEDLATYSNTSLNSRGTSPNSIKRKINNKPASSLSGRGSSQQISSFNSNKQTTSSLRGVSGVSSSINRLSGSTFKPKF